MDNLSRVIAATFIIGAIIVVAAVFAQAIQEVTQ